jgi:hypothetical protein
MKDILYVLVRRDMAWLEPSFPVEISEMIPPLGDAL